MGVSPWFFYIICLVLGLVLGSFYNVCILRLPREESIVWPGSRCPHCHHPLSVADNEDAAALQAGKAADHRPIVPEQAVAVQLDEVCEYHCDEVHRGRPVAVPSDQDLLPGS